jgi:hypothetical protein
MPNARRLVARPLALVLGSLGLPFAASAQHLSLSPTIGIYAPTQDLVNSLVNGGSTLQFKQKVGLALGGRLGLWFSKRIGISATGAYVPSKLQATITQTGLSKDSDKSTSLWFGTGRLNLWLLPPTGLLAVGVNGGVGVVGRGATTATDQNGASYVSKAQHDVGGVVGATVGINLGGLGLSVSADDYIYNPKVFQELGAKSQRQQDLQFSLGLGIPVGR